MEKLFEHYKKLLSETNVNFVRYIYPLIDWESRLIGLTGPRGIGKTTLLLQHIKTNLNPNETLFVSAEDFYFSGNKLIDLADSFIKQGGKYLFIDEIHKYPNWSKELKLMYDYYSELHIVFTGSSILNINKGASDLSRRAIVYKMQGLSFREYLELFHSISIGKYNLEEILEHKVDSQNLKYPLLHFNSYLKNGYYPFALDDNFEQRLMQIVNQTLESDIPIYAVMNVSTGRKLKQLLSIIAKNVPFKPNMVSIANSLSSSRNSIADYCQYIEDAGMISQLRNNTFGIKGLGKVEKIYLDNPNLVYLLSSANPNIGNLRETFFINQMRLNYDISNPSVADFRIDKYTFEVGGKNKGQKQIEGLENGFIVKDDIEFGSMNIVPLWHFGLTY